MGTFRHRKRFFRLVNCFKGPRKWRQYRGCYYLKTPCETIRRPHPLLRATTNNGKEMTTVSRKSYTQIGKLSVDSTDFSHRCEGKHHTELLERRFHGCSFGKITLRTAPVIKGIIPSCCVPYSCVR